MDPKGNPGSLDMNTRLVSPPCSVATSGESGASKSNHTDDVQAQIAVSTLSADEGDLTAHSRHQNQGLSK